MANKFKYRQQYGVIVICKDEAEQKAVYERLAAQGLTYKIPKIDVISEHRDEIFVSVFDF